MTAKLRQRRLVLARVCPIGHRHHSLDVFEGAARGAGPVRVPSNGEKAEETLASRPGYDRLEVMRQCGDPFALCLRG